MVAAADPTRLRRHVEALAAQPRSRRREPAALDRAQAYVAGVLDEAGWSVTGLPFRRTLTVAANDGPGLRWRPYLGLSGINLLARRPGSPDGAAVLVAAHIDSVPGSPGADDNASGVAALLEVARLLAEPATPSAVWLAIIDAEELGLAGASALAGRLRGAVAGALVLESVGCYDERPGSQRLPVGAAHAFPAAAQAIAAGGAAGDFALVVHRRSSTSAAWWWQHAAEERGLRTVLVRDPRADGRRGLLGTVLRPWTVHLERSDHAAFWHRGVPALMVTDTASFRNPHYHRPTDTPDTLDYRRLAAVAEATADAARAWAEPVRR